MSIVENIKDVVALARKLDNIELERKMADLQTEFIGLTHENQALRAEVAALKLAASEAKALKYDPPFYYAPDDKVPMCPRCWESDKKQVHLQGPFRVTGLRWDCPNCNKDFLIQTEEEQNLGPFRRRPYRS